MAGESNKEKDSQRKTTGSVFPTIVATTAIVLATAVSIQETNRIPAPVPTPVAASTTNTNKPKLLAEQTRELKTTPTNPSVDSVLVPGGSLFEINVGSKKVPASQVKPQKTRFQVSG